MINMKIPANKSGRYFSKYEFSAPYILCASDCEPLSLKETLAMADSEMKSIWDGLSLGYTETSGHPLLRDEVSKMHRNVTAEDVLVCTPEEGIFLTMQSLLEAGDHVITTFPAHQSLYQISESIGCDVSYWKHRNLSFDIDDLKALINDKTKMIVINFPHNPTGVTISEEEMKRIVGLAAEKGIIVFSDEMYRYLEHDEATRVSSASDLYENAISLFGMSKSFGLAGLRIGWLVTKNKEIMKRLAQYKDYTTMCNSGTSEILAIIALRAKEKIRERNLSIIFANLDLLDEFFGKFEDKFEWLRPSVGPIAYPKLNESLDVTDFCKDLVDKNGVMLVPAPVYNDDSNRFRIGFGRKNMPEALQHFESFVSNI